MAKNPTKKTVTKKDRTRLEKENTMRQLVYIGMIAVVVLVVGIITYGLLDQFVFKGLQPVAYVDKQAIRTNDFQSQVRYYRQQSVQNYMQALQLYYAYMQISPSLAQQVADNNLSYYQTQLSESYASLLGEDVLDWMINEVIIRNEAKKMGITVSDAEIDEYLQGQFGFYKDGTPTPTMTATSFITSTMSPEQYALVTATPLPSATLEPTQTAVPEETAETEVTEEAAVEEETAAAGTEETVVEATPAATEIVEPTPTATEYTYEGYVERYDEFVGGLEDEEINEKELRETIRTDMLSDKIKDEITADLKPEEEQVWARHILVADEETAQEVLDALAAGGDWTDLAAQYSTDSTNNTSGGDLGWFGRNQMVAAFEDAAYSLEIGEISDPVQTDYGWHIIQVLGHEVRSISQYDFETLKTQAMQDWIEAKKSEYTIEKKDNWMNNIPLEPNIPAEYLLTE